METHAITTDEVRAAANRLVDFHERFAPLFGRDQAQEHAYTYIKGLMICPERKSIEPIALLVGNGQVSAMQKFINVAPWDHEDVQVELQSVFDEELVPTAASSPVGVVGIVDESGFTKKGDQSVGVARQHNGRLGKEDNCQVGGFLVGVTRGGAALLDHQLHLPESWCETTRAGRDRRAKVHVAEAIGFQTKPRVVANLIRRPAVLDTVPLDWVTADEAYGRNGEFLDELEALEQPYVVEVPVNTRMWTTDPASCVPEHSGRGRVPMRPTRESVSSVAFVASQLATREWHRLCVGQGAKGPLVFDFAAIRVWPTRHRQPGPSSWLVMRRSLEAAPEIKYYLSNGKKETPVGVMAQVACTRHTVEEYLEDAKSYLGMAHYETRSWTGWHHHMTLVALAHLFVTLTRLHLKKNSGADPGPYSVVASQRVQTPNIDAGDGDSTGGIPHQAQSNRHSITH
jgi:SRSO17 transposase